MIGHAAPLPQPPGSLSGATLRNSASDLAPAFVVNSTPDFSASPSRRMFSPGYVVTRDGPNDPPLCEMAPRKRPLASGEAQSMLTEIPPADSPKMVTRSGS